MNLTPEQFAHLERLFAEAVDLSPLLRIALVARIRDEEGAAMADHLEALLAAHSEETESMFQPLVRAKVSLPATRFSFKEGDLILKRFRIIRLLGRGGMGEVYEAQDSEIGRVAIKTVRADLRSDRSLQRFKQEVQLARMVTSPYVCRIHEFFTLPAENDRPAIAFLTMEFLEGATLADRIADQGPLPWRDAESIALQLCQGIEAIHSAGIIHRDLKSRNVMLTTHNGAPRAVVMDLGLARRPELDDGLRKHPAPLTLAGTIMGTPDYMAPEQFEGGPVTPATDIYAFGVVLYEMVTGKLPFEASTPMAAAVRRAKRPPTITSVQPASPHRLDLIVEKCLEFEPTDRFGSVAEVAKALRGETAESARRHLLSNGMQRRWAIVLLAAVLLAVIAAFFVIRQRVPRARSGSSEAKLWYDRGTAALREGTYLKAANALQMAVDLDKNYVLAHVRLADAWNELDFSGKAKDEMLDASLLGSKGTLSDLEKTYVEAVRHTIVRDFPAALRDYQAILGDLPPDRKADGYVDLGRAYEKSGNIEQAVANYSVAARLAPEYPASFVRLAVLEDRRKHTAAADAAYARAERLYRAASNMEGLAEIDLQRGHNANTQLRLDEARIHLQRSLQTARAIRSLQLEIRGLTRLSVTEYLANNSDKSLQLANQAVELAQRNDLDYWAIDALTRIGNAYISRGDYEKAGPKFEQALNLAEHGKWPRLMALANYGLAQVRLSQNKAGDALSLAGSALEYYRANGFKSESAEALTLVFRAQRQSANNQAALKSGQQLLALAAELNEPSAKMRAEEAVGSLIIDLERYPEAIDHFQQALAASRELKQQIEYHLLDYAEALWRLGDYEGAARTLRSIPAAARELPEIALRLKEANAGMFLSQKRYSEVKEIARTALADKSNDDPGFFYRVMGQIETVHGSPERALDWGQKALDQAQKESDRAGIAAANLILANAYLAGGATGKALALAQAAHDFFAASNRRESEYLALLSLAKISRAANNPADSRRFAQQGMDILSGFKDTYSTQQYKTYLSRPDVRDVSAQFARLVK
jgi:tetratricopeptide (TPR) repeat protein